MKRLWVLPLAALLCGRPVNPPRLKPPLPESKEACLAKAQKLFLLSFAYRQESPTESEHLLAASSKTLSECEEPVLRARIEEFKSSAL